jgi:hypothetical protein
MYLHKLSITYLFKEEDKLDDERGEAVDAGDEISKADQKLSFSKRVE